MWVHIAMRSISLQDPDLFYQAFASVLCEAIPHAHRDICDRLPILAPYHEQADVTYLQHVQCSGV